MSVEMVSVSRPSVARCDCDRCLCREDRAGDAQRGNTAPPPSIQELACSPNLLLAHFHCKSTM